MCLMMVSTLARLQRPPSFQRALLTAMPPTSSGPSAVRKRPSSLKVSTSRDAISATSTFSSSEAADELHDLNIDNAVCVLEVPQQRCIGVERIHLVDL